MLVETLSDIGTRLYTIRKSKGLTQAEVAERAELSDRTYADIERGSTNMRVETLIKICSALHITPDDILVIDPPLEITEQDIVDAVQQCSNDEKKTILKLMSVYIASLK